MIDLKSRVNQSDFGEIVGISQPAVSDLLSRNVISKGANLGQWIIEYCCHLREIAAGRAASGGLDLAEQRARLAKEQADKVAMQNAERRGEVAPVAVMEMVLASTGSKVGKILDTIPGLVRRRVPGISSEVIEEIASNITKCRNMAASMTLLSIEDDEEDQDDDGLDRSNGS